MSETPKEEASDDAVSERVQLAAEWEKARHAVFAQLLAGVGSYHDAEDILQEVAVSVAKNFRSYDSSRPFTAWALGIARNHILMYFRKHRRDRLVFNDHLMGVMSRHFEAIADEPSDLRREALHKCLRQLNPERRRLVELRYSGGLSINQIAERIGQSTAAVKGSLHRVRKVLEKCVRTRTGRTGRAAQ